MIPRLRTNNYTPTFILPQFWTDVYRQPSGKDWGHWVAAFHYCIQLKEAQSPWIAESESAKLQILRSHLGDVGRQQFDSFRFDSLDDALRHFSRYFDYRPERDAPSFGGYVMPYIPVPVNRTTGARAGKFKGNIIYYQSDTKLNMLTFTMLYLMNMPHP